MLASLEVPYGFPFKGGIEGESLREGGRVLGKRKAPSYFNMEIPR